MCYVTDYDITVRLKILSATSSYLWILNTRISLGIIIHYTDVILEVDGRKYYTVRVQRERERERSREREITINRQNDTYTTDVCLLMHSHAPVYIGLRMLK